MSARRTCLVLLWLAGLPLLAGPGQPEGYVPAAAHTAGGYGSAWRTDVWIYRQGATLVQLWFNPSGRDNSALEGVPVSLAEPVTFLPDIVADTFHAEGFGSLHYLADGPIEVVSRTWTGTSGGSSYGQMIRGIPLLEAAWNGTAGSAELRMVANQGASSRGNLGIVNVSNTQVTARVDLFLADGTPAPGNASFLVTLKPFEMTQISDVLSRLGPGERPGVIVRVGIPSGPGGILAYLSDVNNSTNDPSYQEAFRFDY